MTMIRPSRHDDEPADDGLTGSGDDGAIETTAHAGGVPDRAGDEDAAFGSAPSSAAAGDGPAAGDDVGGDVEPAEGSVVQSSGRRAVFRAWRSRRPFLGTILTMLGGVELFFSGQLDLGRIHVSLGIEGLQATVIPLALVLLGVLTLLMPAHRIFYGVIGLALALYSIVGVNLGGFLVGMLLAVVGGIMTVAWSPKDAQRKAAAKRARRARSAAAQTAADAAGDSADEASV
ncbi:hypothetical protein GCM10027515_17520 [Schumannella luteola]|uniref:Uncharacterized protein n=1 Tax=Schumannella luteola TaxID=472059 RepID=A0A852YRW6_9MICO|nr:DUF6114 domain-containing protein [Schumannella luteola]NYH00450.1 hypothetical protein [Schumannella luteola]